MKIKEKKKPDCRICFWKSETWDSKHTYRGAYGYECIVKGGLCSPERAENCPDYTLKEDVKY